MPPADRGKALINCAEVDPANQCCGLSTAAFRALLPPTRTEIIERWRAAYRSR